MMDLPIRSSGLKVNFFKLARESVVIIFFVMLFIYALTSFQFAFNFEIYEHGYYNIALFSAVATSFWSLFLLLDGQGGIRNSDMLVMMVLGGQIYWVCNGNEYAGTIASFSLMFFLLRSIHTDKLVLLMYIIFFIYISQILFTSFNLLTARGISPEGVLRNTGVYAIYSIIFIPLCYCVMKRNLKGVYLYISFGVYLLIVSGIVLFLKSRTALIAIFLAYGLPVIFYWLRRQRLYIKIISLGISIITFSVIVYYLFYLKTGSSLGRLLMIKIAFLNASDYVFWGLGFGNFTWNYPQWQSDFFKNNSDPGLAFFLNAGETYVIFNEFIQLFISIGGVLFLFLIYLFSRFLRKTAVVDSDLLKGIRKGFLIIFCCSLTYYTLHINGVLLILIFYLALSDAILQNNLSLVLTKTGLYLKTTIFISSALAILLLYPKYDAARQWIHIKKDMNTMAQDNNGYANVYSNLKNDGKFLADYGNYLYEHNSDVDSAIKILEISKNKFISRESIEILAYLYIEQKEYSKAIKYFEWLVNYIPSRFSYRLELIKLYQKMQRIDKARQLANFTLHMPVKILSSDVLLIKKEIVEINKHLTSTR